MIWFSHHDVPVSSVLPSSAPKLVFVAKVYNEWFGELVDFIAHGQLSADRNKARDTH